MKEWNRRIAFNIGIDAYVGDASRIVEAAKAHVSPLMRLVVRLQNGTVHLIDVNFNLAGLQISHDTYLVPVVDTLPIEAVRPLRCDLDSRCIVHNEYLMCVRIALGGDVSVVVVRRIYEIEKHTRITMAVLFAGLLSFILHHEAAKLEVLDQGDVMGRAMRRLIILSGVSVFQRKAVPHLNAFPMLGRRKGKAFDRCRGGEIFLEHTLAFDAGQSSL